MMFTNLMKRPTETTLTLLLALFCTAPSQTEAQHSPDTIVQPPTAPVEETICGMTVSDPYRPLENLQDPLVKRWFRQESRRARSTLQKIPGRRELIEKMHDFDRRKTTKVHSLFITDNDRYFYLRQTPADETGKLFCRDGFKGRERLLFDPETYSGKDGVRYVISKVAPNDDGSKVALTVSPNGSEDAVILVMEVKDRKIFPERIDRCWFASPSWIPDGSGFLYNRLRPGGLHDKQREMDSKVYLHLVGTDPSNDREIFSREKYPELDMRPEDIPGVDYDKESGHLYAFAFSVDRRLNAWYAPTDRLSGISIPWKRLFRPDDEVYDFAATERELYLYTPRNAPHFTLLKTSLRDPDIAHAETVIPERPDATLSAFTLTCNGVYYTISVNGVREELYFRKFDALFPEKLELPFSAGTVALSSKGFRFPDVWAIMAGWNRDYRRFRFDPNSGSFRNETLSSPAAYPEYESLTVEELMVPSHDGVRVPLSMVYSRNLVKNGKNPVLLYGYGAYGNALTPFFSPALLLWTWKGGLLAVAHVRGGGELGDAWHKAGMKTAKPNTWKDFIACAEYLVREGYTSSGHVAINGASAGGILVGRAMTERPDLFAAAMPQVGLLNPLRGEQSPNGPVNVPEFGTVNKPDECRALLEMDPYLHLRKGTSYPATLVTAGMNDPRVIAWQPAKFAARLMASTASPEPVLFFTDYEAGHGVGDPKSKQFESLADILSFGLWQTGHPDFQIK
jgi:prolyl oligopeptidase